MISPSVLEGAKNCVENYGHVQEGDNVLILNEPQSHRVEDTVIDALVAAVKNVGADADVMYTRHLRDSWWEDVPSPVVAAYEEADVVIHNHYTIGKPHEEIYDAMYNKGSTKLRNYATTERIMGSRWAQFPAELSNAIEQKIMNLAESNDTYRYYSDTGTDIVGDINHLIEDERYDEGVPVRASRESQYILFPPGVFNGIRSSNAEGTIMVESVIPWGAELWGLPKTSFEPVELTVENNEVIDFQGRYAKQLEKGFEMLMDKGGVPEDEVYNVDSFHSGTVPHTHTNVHPKTDPDYAWSLMHHHTGMSHFHIGGDTNKDYGTPYFTHISAGDHMATIKIGDTPIIRDGDLALKNDDEIQKIAAKYGDPDQILATEPFWGF